MDDKEAQKKKKKRMNDNMCCEGDYFCAEEQSRRVTDAERVTPSNRAL